MLFCQNGMTCAHIAASKGSVAVVKELMRFNKSVVTTARNKVSNIVDTCCLSTQPTVCFINSFPYWEMQCEQLL